MKKLIMLSALLLLTGAGCTTINPNNTQFTQEGENNTVLKSGEIGFTVAESNDWGVFTVTLHKRSTSNSSLGENWEYQGSFSKQTGVYYRASDPEHIIAREGYPGDMLGYKKVRDTYFVIASGMGGEAEPIEVPEELIVGEIPLANGYALLLKGPEESDGPSPFPNSPGELVAYINTPNGPLSGGVFIADANAGISIEEMKAVLATVTIE